MEAEKTIALLFQSLSLGKILPPVTPVSGGLMHRMYRVNTSDRSYAVKHLKQVVENASPLDGMPLFSSIKEGTQKKNGYKNMILLYYKFDDEQLPYLNFIAKLTIGVTAENKHIQYSVNKVEVNTT